MERLTAEEVAAAERIATAQITGATTVDIDDALLVSGAMVRLGQELHHWHNTHMHKAV